MNRSATAKGSEPPYPRPGYAWYVVVLLTLAYLVSFVDRQILGLLAEPIKRDLGISDVQMSWLMGLSFALLYVGLGIPIGWLADRRSRKHIIAAGITVWCLMTAACGLAKSYGQLFMARVGVGVGEAALTPPALSLISDYFPRERVGRAIGFYTMGISLGMGVAYIVGGKVIGWVMNAPPLVLPGVGELYAWQSVFLVVGLPGLVLAALMLTVKEPLRRGRLNQGAALSLGDAARYLIKRWRIYGSLVLGKTVLTIVGYSLFWVPAMFGRTWGWDIPAVGLWFGLVLLIFGPLGTNLGGWLGDFLYQRGLADGMVRTLIVCICILAPTYAIAPLMPSAELALLCYIPATLTSAAATAAGNAALMIVTPNELRAQVSAVALLVISVSGLIIGPTVVAMFTDYYFGDEAALRYSMAIVPALFGALSLAVVLWGRRFYAEEVARI